MPILTNSGRVAIAESIKAQPLHIAWGGGDGEWLEPPVEDSNATDLLDEIGRLTATSVEFVAPDAAGNVVVPGGIFAVSATPTNHLLITANFNFTDAPSAVIREMAVFVGSQMIGGLPAGQTYFVPSEVSDAGRMLHVENFAPIYRSPAIRESFQIVISF